MAITTAPSQDLKADKAADFGDEVKTEEEQSDVEAIAEPWEKYDLNGTPHVFYPLCLGEVLDERYLVEHKIGFGGFSTVWMAHDLKTKTDVALKIFSLGEWGEHETHMQNEILQNVQDTSNLVTCSASFLLPAGSSKSHHRVLVLPLVGPCITSLILDRMSLVTHMSAAKQLLEALERLSSHDCILVSYLSLTRVRVEKYLVWSDVWAHYLSNGRAFSPTLEPWITGMISVKYLIQNIVLQQRFQNFVLKLIRPSKSICSPSCPKSLLFALRNV
ncbi:protein kinase [Histoplasma capsulatum var. duboisii H88]|uniref:Protein kinase n=1 Tax=Ajellomyces capsulatus (strain H88) TaxID=544711 RepID=A0A8A1L819_AJEC8|nr:protein kinase [Histoplasma capsulatum var. duboisii H88]